MPVEFISNGYDTTPEKPYGEAVWADSHPVIGLASYGVRSALDWKVSAVAGQDRTVSIAAGRGYGHGVTDKTVANDTIQLDTITSGSRWDLIVCRRDWTPTAGVSQFVKVNGGATAVIPGGRLSAPGEIDDQPIALVQVTSGQTQPTSIIDLRTWAGDGGGLIAKHDLVRSYMDAVGTRLNVDGTNWIRRVGANDTPEWINEFGSGQWVELTMPAGWVSNGICRARTVHGGAFLHVAVDARYTGGPTILEGWIIANLPASLRPFEGTFVPGTTNSYNSGTFYAVSSAGISVGPRPIGNIVQLNGLVPLR